MPACAEATASAPAAPDSSLRGAPAAARRLSLDDALHQALVENWDVASRRNEVALARAAQRAAHEFPNPGAALLTSRIHTDGMGDGTELGNSFWERSYDTVIGLGQLVEIGGKRSARQASAAHGLAASRARLADMRRTVAQSVVAAYTSAALAEGNAAIALESAGYLRDEAHIAEVRWEAGDISRSDREQIEIAAARLELDAASSEAVAREQRVALEWLIGVPQPVGSLRLADTLETLAGLPPSLPRVEPNAVRPDLMAADATLEKANADLALERALRIPDPTLQFQFEHEPPDRSNSVGLGVSLPLPLWNRNGSGIAAAESEREQAANDRARVAASVRADLETAQTSFDEARARWLRYRDELKPRSQEIRESVSLAYEKGGASLLDLLQAQRSDNDVRLEAIQAAADAVTSRAALESAHQAVTQENLEP